MLATRDISHRYHCQLTSTDSVKLRTVSTTEAVEGMKQTLDKLNSSIATKETNSAQVSYKPLFYNFVDDDLSCHPCSILHVARQACEIRQLESRSDIAIMRPHNP